MPKLKAKRIVNLEYHKNDMKNGYNNQFLDIDISENIIKILPIEKKIREKFIGGKGFDLWLMWDFVNENTHWNNPNNPICIASGPMGGIPNYPGSGKSIVTSISPLTRSVVDSNVGGYFGPYLKFSGFDALRIIGKSKKNIVILIDGINQNIEVLDFIDLPNDSYSLSNYLTENLYKEKKSEISVVSSGPGGKNTLMGCLNFSWYDNKRKKVRYKQAGRGGIGTVFSNKGIKAVVGRWDRISLNINNPADIIKLKKVAKLHSKEIVELDPKQNEMSKIGTTHLVSIMNDFDLLPVNNFQYGSDPRAKLIGSEVFSTLFDPGYDGCWKGCTVSCSHGIKDFIPVTGPYEGKKVFVDGPEYETIAGCGSNLGIFDPYTIIELNFYCDTYGLDTISVGTTIAFAMESYEKKIINDNHTGNIKLNFGNRLAALTLVHQMALGIGFGSVLGQGIKRLKKIFINEYKSDPLLVNDIGMESKGLEFSEYMTKESLAQQGGYGMALKGAQHDEAWLIFLDMVHNFMPTFEKKAEALHWFPMFRTWFSLCGLCKLPWNDIVPKDNNETKEPAKVSKHIKWYSEYFESVTGKKVNPDDLISMSEAVYNFQRVFNLKMGFGKRDHDTLPYRAMGPVTIEEYNSRKSRYDSELINKYNVVIENKEVNEKINILRNNREKQYELLKDAVYKRRGWNKDGIPKLKTLKRLGINFPKVIKILKENNITE